MTDIVHLVIIIIVRLKGDINKYCSLLDIPEMYLSMVYKFITTLNYTPKYIALANKPNEIGIYLLGISVEDFIHFMRNYVNIPPLLEYVIVHKEELRAIEHEVGFHFNKDSQNFLTPNRFAFYGIF